MARNNQDGDTPAIPAKRTRRASFRLVDSDNDAEIELSSHREARAAAASSSRTPLPPRRAGTKVSTRNGSVSCEEVDDDDEGSETGYSAAEGGAKRRKVKKSKGKGKGMCFSH